MNVFAKFDEITSMILEVIKETKCYGHRSVGRSFVRSDGQRENTVCRGINIYQRTNGPVNAHLISWPSKAQNIQNLENIW